MMKPLHPESSIVVTGAAGFIGSCLVSRLNQAGYERLILVDDFSVMSKSQNLQAKRFEKKIERELFVEWFKEHAAEVSFVFHIGARTDTTEQDEALLSRLNLEYTKSLWSICTSGSIPFVYASSAATYGGGEHGYTDSHVGIPLLQPLNPYGWSKHRFDLWALEQTESPPSWHGLKFFNVYGPNEYHKGRMASVIFHAYHQILEKGSVRLFRSHRPDYADGWQLRDFVYVKDVVEVCLHLMEKATPSGIYNLGSGTARSFYDLAAAVFSSLKKQTQIEYVDMPIDIRDKYQYFTEADMSKLISAGYSRPFTRLEEGVADYVGHYLRSGAYF